MPQKAKPSQLTRDLLARFDVLLWTYGGPAAGPDAGPDLGLLRVDLPDKDYVQHYEHRRSDSHATLHDLDRRGKDLVRVYTVIATAREQEILMRAAWAAIDRERTRRMLLKRVPRRPEWQWLRSALSRSTLVVDHAWLEAIAPYLKAHGIPRRDYERLILSPRLTRGRRGGLGQPWLRVAEAQLKALRIPPRDRDRLFRAYCLAPFSIAG